MPSKYTDALKAQGHSLTMILINVANVLKQISDDPVLDEQITESIDLLVKYFIHPEFKALLEMVGPNGEFIDTLSGRVINPGHCIETSWFLMDVAVARNDSDLLKTALKILDWSWNWGWDKKYGGIISFKDCRNLPPQCYEQDMKFWWPQCETIIATAYAYELTGNEKYFKWHKLSSDWAWKHLKDKKFPEWYGYLHRDGTVAQRAKGNIFKGPFHIPRMLVKMQEICRKIDSQKNKG
jgi:N-acylglucosamine 2-epimerase